MRKIILPLSVSLLLTVPFSLAAQEAVEAIAEPAAAAVPVVKLVGLSGVYADHPESGFDLTSVMLGGGAGKTKPFYDLIQQLDALAKDEESRQVLFDLSQAVGFNLAQMAELERCLGKLREAGVKCYAYVENAAGAQYSIASQCDEILMADMGTLDIGAPALSTMYLKDALDMLGVEMDVLRCGDFKGAAEPFMLSRMSPHLRSHYEAMLGDMNADVVRRIAKGRGMKAEDVRKLQSVRMLSAEAALSAGLVDRLVPWQGAKQSLAAVIGPDFETQPGLKKKKQRSLNLMSLMQSLLKPADEEEVEDKTLAVLHLSGPIVDGVKPVPGSIVSGPMVEAIRSIENNDNVQGVVVRINSPGGSATASEAIVLALAKLAERKPVVCSMGNVAGSGGYYVTCFGRPILAEAGTITGSIGVLGVKPNLGPLLNKFGLHEELIALDESAGMSSMTRSWSDADKELMQAHMNDVYDRFVGHVAKSRKLSREQVLAIAGGRVWSGQQAVDNHLIDRLGGLDDALAMVAAEAKVGDDYDVIHLPRPRTFMDTFAAEMMEVRVLVPHPLPAALLRRLEGGLEGPLAVLWDALQSETPTRVWALMPATLRVR